MEKTKFNKQKSLKDRMFNISDYKDFKKAEIIQSKVISSSPEKDLVEVILAVGEATEVYPTHKIKNLNKYCAKAAQILCLENNLSSFGTQIFLDDMIRNYKNLPSLSEINSAVKNFVKEIEEFNPWFERQTYNSAHKSFMNDLDAHNIVFHSTDLQSFRHLFFTWPKVFPYDGFMDTKKFNPPDYEYLELLRINLSFPLSENIIFFLLDVMLKFNSSRQRAFGNKGIGVIDLDKDSIAYEIRKQFPKAANASAEVPFLTPSQWVNFNWEAIRINTEGWDDPFEPFQPGLFRQIVYNQVPPNVYSNLKILTKQHFELEDMLS